MKSEFISCCNSYRKCPAPDKPEYAFVGRSNVGKSSLINCLCGRKNLAKTSATPGKTQCLVHFLIDEKWYIADLPGYGYARTAQTQRAGWQKMTREYLLKRDNLACVFVLVDLRLAPQAIDLAFLRFLGENGVPLCIIGTKADKLSKKQLADSVRTYQNTLAQEWEPLPPFIVSSSTTGLGREEILKFIENSL